jgi:Ala-tRNA(Pro) deacylase
MMPVEKLRKFLDEHRVKYVTISHSRAFTAMEIAASAHVSGKELAKTVMVKVDGEMAMVVLPASCRVDMEKLRAAAGAGETELATETEFRDRFPDCEAGAMPPFGNLYEMKVYAARELAADEAIAFNAGSHTELIRLPYKDFERLVRPAIVQISA